MSTTAAGTPRENVYADAQPPSGWGHAGTAAMVGSTAYGVGRGMTLGSSMSYLGYANPLTAATFATNPWARRQQNVSDSHYLRDSRQHDAAAGLPSFRKTSYGVRMNRAKISRAPMREMRGLTDRLARFFGGGRESGRTLRSLGHSVKEGVRTDRFAEYRPGRLLPSRRLSGSPGGEFAAEVLTTADRFRNATMPEQALALGGVTAGLYGASRAAQAGLSGLEGLRTNSRFDAAKRHVNMDEALGLTHFDPDDRKSARREAEARLRKRFSVLNKYAPSVAKDPLLAAEFLGRDALYDQDALSPEQYLQKVRTAVDLEGSIAKTRPDVMSPFRNSKSLF